MPKGMTAPQRALRSRSWQSTVLLRPLPYVLLPMTSWIAPPPCRSIAMLRSRANSSSRIMRCGTVITTSTRFGQRLPGRMPRMNRELTLLAVLAHPDDESLGFGGTLAKYAAEGVETHLVTATRGERGRFGSSGKSGDPIEVGRVREVELRAAAAVLGIREVSVRSYPDGAVDKVQASIAIR